VTPLLDEPALVRWGAAIGQAASGQAAPAAPLELPAVLALRGELGAGKSVLARAVARGAGVAGELPSPTFNLLYRYEGAGGVAVYHLDLYRLEDPDEVWELGWEELGEGRQIVLIEWPERAEALLPARRWDISLREPAPGVPAREVTVVPRGGAGPLPEAG
jgi:tRNA threonylcarbamoyladenosine biosynthesis protein TsaE